MNSKEECLHCITLKEKYNHLYENYQRLQKIHLEAKKVGFDNLTTTPYMSLQTMDALAKVPKLVRKIEKLEKDIKNV